MHTWRLGGRGNLKADLEQVRLRKERKGKADDIQAWQAAGTLACRGVWDARQGSRVGILVYQLLPSLIR